MDLQAAQSLLDELLPRLRRLAAALNGRGPSADDLVVQTWEGAIKELDRFDGQRRFDLWVVERMVRVFLSAQGEAALDSGEQLARLRALGEIGNTRVCADSLMAGMCQLPPIERTAVALVCVEGLGYGEAARALDLPMKAFVQRLTAGRRALINGLGGIDAVIGGEAA